MSAEETRIGSWSLHHVAVRIMWAVILGGVVAFAIGSSGLAAVIAVAVMVATYLVLTVIVSRR
jgi:hypothetical protein